ncbi:MAG TPA: serine hydrolase [Bryobacteraceae bacterium]|nr:serine hydrolase [Bryobacteraceae bacterium]
MYRALFAVFLSLPALAADKASALDALVGRYRELGLFNGSALVAENGQPILRKGYGEANMEWHIANTPDTRFRLGSITKQFTATLVMQMVEKGQIDLSAPIARYLPDYPKAVGDRVTIHQLLNHTSGIPGYTELPSFGSEARRPQKPAEFMKMFSGLDLLFDPGTKYSYSNSGFFLLGVILEKVSGKSYEQLLKERIFEPLGMKQSGYDSPRPILEKRASGYDSTLDGYFNTGYLDMGEPFSAGSLYSSVDDLLIWDQALYGEKILSTASKEKMFTPGLNNYGYAFVIHKGAVTRIEHGGGINGFNTVISRDIEPKRLYVLLNNTGGAPLSDMVEGLRAILEGKDPKAPKTPAAPVLYKTWQSGGIHAVMEQWTQMKQGSTYDTSEGELTRLAGALAGKGKVDDALVLAREASAMAPKSAGTAMFLGQVESAAGHKVEALQAYGKAMELSDTPRAFPLLTHAIQQLSVVAPKK